MQKLKYLNQSVSCQDHETVLDALLRQNQTINYSCRTGICHTCVLKCSAGSPGAEAQKSLAPELVAKGYFLPCQCRPDNDLTIEAADPQDLFVNAVVREKQWLCDSVVKLQLQPESNIMYQGGQFLNVRHPAGHIRSYSIAGNFLDDPYIELHIKHYSQGVVSHWLCDSVKEGDSLAVQGPQGQCYYQKSLREKNLLLIANGTGLAPLQGIIRDALLQGHQGKIVLYHGSRWATGVYNRDFFSQLQQQHPELSYHPCVSGETAGAGVLHGRADTIAFAQHPTLKDWAVFACGIPAMVQNAVLRAKQQGAAEQDIFVEKFTSPSATY